MLVQLQRLHFQRQAVRSAPRRHPLVARVQRGAPKVGCAANRVRQGLRAPDQARGLTPGGMHAQRSCSWQHSHKRPQHQRPVPGVRAAIQQLPDRRHDLHGQRPLEFVHQHWIPGPGAGRCGGTVHGQLRGVPELLRLPLHIQWGARAQRQTRPTTQTKSSDAVWLRTLTVRSTSAFWTSKSCHSIQLCARIKRWLPPAPARASSRMGLAALLWWTAGSCRGSAPISNSLRPGRTPSRRPRRAQQPAGSELRVTIQ